MNSMHMLNNNTNDTEISIVVEWLLFNTHSEHLQAEYVNIYYKNKEYKQLLGCNVRWHICVAPRESILSIWIANRILHI